MTFSRYTFRRALLRKRICARNLQIVTMTTHGYKIADWTMALSLGWTPTSLQEKIIELDRTEMEGLTDARGGTALQWSPIFADHRESWRVMLDAEERIVGYWHFLALASEIFHEAKAGLLSEAELSSEHLAAFEIPGTYDIYIAGLVLAKDYRTSHALIQLLSSFLDVLEGLAKDEVFIRD